MQPDVGYLFCNQFFLSMTAIAIAHNKAGFVIAADGRSRFSENPSATLREDETNNAQKIFRSNVHGASVAWALAGQVFNPEGTWDLIQDTNSAFEVANAVPHIGCTPWLHSFQQALREAVLQARAKDLIAPFQPDLSKPHELQSTIASVFIVGYFCNNRPSSAVIDITHEHGTLSDPLPMVLHAAVFGEKHNQYYGSREIAARWFGSRSDNRFHEYYCDPGRTQEEALAHVIGYIKACSCELAREVDPVVCNGIGGHIHAASVTPDGFRWLIEPGTA
jgi:hypothetical protein